MRKQTLLWMGLLLCFVHAASAQKQVTGKVTDSKDGSPLSSVSVKVKGSNVGVATGSDGVYTITIPEKASALIFSYVGFADQEIAVTGNTSSVILVQSSAPSLSEVVVVGYGTQAAKTISGKVTKVRASDLALQPVTSVDQALQGKAAGVQVNAGSGKLGQAVQVKVRGQSSITASTQPLFVVDGIPITAITGGFGEQDINLNGLADINFQDVESVEILKDAAASAIYGSRGANGVVIITTKKGKTGRTSVNATYQYGKSDPTKKVDFLNSEQYKDFYLKAAGNADKLESIDPTDPDSYTTYILDYFDYFSYGKPNDYNTVWGDHAFQDAPFSQLDVNISGGNEKTTFYASGQHLDQNGILVGNQLVRYSGRLNVEHKITSWAKFGLNMNLARTSNKRLAGDRQFDNPMQIVALSPITPLNDPETGLPAGTPPGDPNIPVYFNPLVNVGNVEKELVSQRNISNIYGEVEIFKGLSFRSEASIDFSNQYQNEYYNSKVARNTAQTEGLGTALFAKTENYNLNNYLTYKKSLENHDISATLGTSYQKSNTNGNSVTGIRFPSNSYKAIISAAEISAGQSTKTGFSFSSYFLRANYAYKQKYLLSGSLSVDESSRFGKNEKQGFFPAVSAGWILSEENFLADIKPISMLKIRASYGRTGNAEIGNFASLGLVTGVASYNQVPGQAQTTLANPDLTWETTDQFDIGVDFGLFKNRISGEVDYYNKQTKGLLLSVNVPATTGFSTQLKNVGTLENTGFEFVLNTVNITGHSFQWRTSFNAAFNTNKVLNLKGQIIEGGLNNMSRAVEGQPVGLYFTKEYAGVDPANGDALWYLNTDLADGSKDRTTTNSYNDAQRVNAGSALPKWVGGITNTFSYKGFDLSVFFNGQFGNKINFYGVGRYSSANGRYEDNQTVDQLAAWTTENTKTNIPEARLYSNNGAQPSTRFIYDGWYVRLRNVSLSYSLPKNAATKLHLNSLRFFVSAQNLALFTDYAGWDPELNADDVVTNIAQGYDFYTAPQARTFTGGVSIGF